MQLRVKPLAVAVVVGVSVLLSMTGCGKKEQPRAMGAMPVQVQELQFSDAVVRTQLPGRANAYCVAEVRPQASGVILKRLFTEGAEVKEGESLFLIDPAVYEASVQSARAAVAQAQANLMLKKADAKRSSRLVKSKAVSQSADDAAQAQLKVAEADLLAAKAALRSAEVNLRYTKVTSPISGKVSMSEVTPGALVTANQANRLTVVQQLDPIYVDVTQSFSDLEKLRQNVESGVIKQKDGDKTEVTLMFDDGTDYAHKGVLTFKDALVDEGTGTVRIRAVFPNPERRLMPGMFVRAKLVDGVRERVIKLDQRSVMRRTNGMPFVYVVNQTNHVESRDIVIEGTEGTNYIVTKGLKPNEKVIVEGILKVRPGALVAPMKAGMTHPQAMKK